MLFDLVKANLSLFEGEGAGSAPTSGDNSNADTGSKKGDDLKNVVYGKQAAAAEPEQASTESADASQKKPSAEDREKAYADLINGEYKDLYTRDTQKMIDKRFKQTKELEQNIQKSQPLMATLAEKYGLDASDIDGITNAVNQDAALWQEAADREGMTVPQYMQFQQYKRESEALRQAEAARTNEERANQQLAVWTQQAEALKQTFPEFDLQVEAANPDFISMLRAGAPVELAYKAIHMDDIVTQSMKATAQAAEKKTVDHIRAMGSRPAENGISGRSAFTVKDDVTKLTKADRAEIARRAERGEVIRF